MDELFEKLKEYLSMDKEIPFTEFSEYFEKVLKVIGDEYKEYKQEQLEKARFIFSILQSNAVERGSRKDKNTKKYKKMAEKCNLWISAMDLCLKELGLTQAEIDASNERLLASV